MSNHVSYLEKCPTLESKMKIIGVLSLAYCYRKPDYKYQLSKLFDYTD